MPQNPIVDQVHDRIVTMLAARLPIALRGLASAREQRLGPNGLGLDSVTIVEILLECEQQFDMPFPTSLFDAGPLTVGRLVDHAAAGLLARQAP